MTDMVGISTKATVRSSQQQQLSKLRQITYYLLCARSYCPNNISRTDVKQN